MTRAEWRESLSVALATIASQKLRAFLTTFGVVIGVASVISVAAIIDGLNTYVAGKINEIGSGTFFVSRFPAFTLDFERMPEEVRMRKHLTAEDAEAIREHCPSVAKVTPLFTRMSIGGPTMGGSNEVRYQNNSVEEPFLRGAEPELVDVIPVHAVVKGRFMTPEDNRRAAFVCILGSAIADNLFGPLDPIGRTVRLNGLPFLVIGVAQPHQGLFGSPGGDQIIVIPFRTFKKMYPEFEEAILVMKAVDPQSVARAMEETVEVLRRRRHVPLHKPNDFDVGTLEIVEQLWQQLTGAIVILTLLVASIALLVGGIGVMNIMLVSVTERTAEIGLRKAVGARRKDIRAQFLLEAVTLTSVGGVIGILTGAVVSAAVATLAPALPARLSWVWTSVGFLISIAVGLFFGIYPAVKASNLEPVRCLRYE